jgi:hypothetical protein
MIDFWTRLLEYNARFLAHALREAADWLDAAAPGPPVVAYPVLFSYEEEFFVSAVTVPDTAGTLQASVAFKDVHGHDTQPSETPQWSSSDEGVASVSAGGDGLSAEVTIAGPGVSLIEVRAGEVVSQGSVTVTPGDAVIGEVTFGPAEEILPSPPEQEEGQAEQPAGEQPVGEQPVDEGAPGDEGGGAPPEATQRRR